MTKPTVSDATIAAVFAFAEIADNKPDLLPKDVEVLAKDVYEVLMPLLGDEEQEAVDAVIRQLKIALADARRQGE